MKIVKFTENYLIMLTIKKLYQNILINIVVIEFLLTHNILIIYNLLNNKFRLPKKFQK